jgi:hypothetical protein
VAVLADFMHIRHYNLRLWKHCSIDSLQYGLRLGKRIAVYSKKRIVDIAVSKWLKRNQASTNAEFIG